MVNEIEDSLLTNINKIRDLLEKIEIKFNNIDLTNEKSNETKENEKSNEIKENNVNVNNTERKYIKKANKKIYFYNQKILLLDKELNLISDLISHYNNNDIFN